MKMDLIVTIEKCKSGEKRKEPQQLLPSHSLEGTEKITCKFYFSIADFLTVI
jgi:hypothetical protein